MKSVSDWAEEVYTLACEKGWWEGAELAYPPDLAAKIALIHSEVSEVLEAVRDRDLDLRLSESGKPEGAIVELADVVIRCLDLSEALYRQGRVSCTLEKAMQVKTEYNRTRQHRHGGRAL